VKRAALLDVNVLVALFDSDHIHHDLAHDWFADHRAHGWATCPVTENGMLRVLANPKYGSPVSQLPILIDLLRKFTRDGRHAFWTETVSLTDRRLFDPSVVRGHAQITDVYLLGLAHRRGGCLATFDRTIPRAAVVGAGRESLAVVGPVASDEQV
jgi:toxin-antitoxin system PIN domain toxin